MTEAAKAAPGGKAPKARNQLMAVFSQYTKKKYVPLKTYGIESWLT